MRSFEDSLQRLGLARVDLVLVHNLDEHVHGEEALPGLFATAMGGGVKALEGLRRAGAIAAFGLGVNRWEVCEAALEEADFDCFLLGGLYTLLTQAPLATLLPRCAARGVSIICGAPYNGGALFEQRRIGAVCARHGVPAGAAALQFPLAHPAVASVIPGARSAAEQAENAAWARRPIPADLWAELKAEGLLGAEAPCP
jgi:D-threo-aldose 1-dehydrogenase